MKDVPANHKILSELMVLLLDGTITEEQFEVLENQLDRDCESVEYCVEFLTTWACLRQPGNVSAGIVGVESFEPITQNAFWEILAESEKTAVGVEVERKETVSKQMEGSISERRKAIKRRRRVSRLSAYTAVCSTAALLIMMLYLFFGPQPRTSQSEPAAVATIVKSVDAVWANSDRPTDTGLDLMSVGYKLEHGLVKIRFDKGAEMIVESPAEFELVSSDCVNLYSGKISAMVDPESIGFTVNTPNARIIDLGTEFGISVSGSGDTDVHVFQGGVALLPERKDEGKEKPAPLLLGKDKAMRINHRDNCVKEIRVDKRGFVRDDEFEANVSATKGSSFHRWLVSSYKLSRDESLVAYYTFDEESESSGELINYACSTQGKLSGRLGDGNDPQTVPSWTEGRWPGKSALEFDRRYRQYVVVPHDDLLNISKGLTISAWVKRTGKLRGGHIVSKREGDKPVAYQFAIFGQLDDNPEESRVENILQFMSDEPKNQALDYSEHVVHPTEKWQHVAVTYNNAYARFYIDGKLVDRINRGVPLRDSTADLLIGTHGLDSDSEAFEGLMDEVAIFKRALSSQEILAMYENGKVN